MSDVSIVVSPRERFGSIVDSLRSMFATIDDDTRVIVFDPDSPPTVKRALVRLQAERYFDLHLLDYPINPNEARNLGFAEVDTPYVVFTDNDIYFADAWLDHLVEHAQAQAADLVAPLICLGPPLGVRVHHAGGRILADYTEQGEIEVREEHQAMDEYVSELDQHVSGNHNEVCEFHCFLARSAFIAKIGPFDERMSSREQMDLALRAKYHGAKVCFEKHAVVNYMSRSRYIKEDLPYMSVRWSDEWAMRSVDAFCDTWGVYLDRHRILDSWVREHRFRAYASCFEDDLAELGRRAFKLIHMDTCEPEFIAQATLARHRLPPPRIPAPLDSVRVSEMLETMARERIEAKINALPNGPAPQYHSKVIAGMATMPSRLGTVVKALASIIEQVDQVVLFLDRFAKPLEITHPKIKLVTSQEMGDLRANGKFIGLLDQPEEVFYASVDDDNLYPTDYIETLVKHYQGSPIGVHGSTFTESTKLTSYLQQREVRNRAYPLDEFTHADVLGTCTSFFHSRDLCFDVRAWEVTNMVDLMFAIECRQAGLGMSMIPRHAAWVDLIASEQADSIYAGLKKDDSVQTVLANKLLGLAS